MNGTLEGHSFIQSPHQPEYLPKHEESPQRYLAKGDFVYRHDYVPVFVKAEGCTFTDEEGCNYLAGEAANGTASLGFDATILCDAMQELKDIPSMPSFCETKVRRRFAKRLGNFMRTVTGADGRICFELGGAQGMELALRIVRANNKRAQYAVFEGGYHGRSVFMSQLSASYRYRSQMGDWRVPVIRLPYPDFEYYSGNSRESVLKMNLDRVRKSLDSELAGIGSSSQGLDCAALIIEPVLNAGGIVKPDKEYLETVVKLFRERGALIVVDEVFCGFYRTGKPFGFCHYDIEPDLIVMSKAVTNGVTPLSCVWVREPLASEQHFPPGSHSATYINNTLALAVGDVVLRRYQDWTSIDDDIAKLEISIDEIVRGLVKRFSHLRSSFVIGGMARILLRDNSAGSLVDLARSVARTRPINNFHGAILASTGMTPNVLAINPPLNISTSHLETFEQILFHTFQQFYGNK